MIKAEWTNADALNLQPTCNQLAVKNLPSEQPEPCDVCRYHGLEDGGTLYISADWDGGIGFDYIRNIHYCPVCGRRLPNE